MWNEVVAAIENAPDVATKVALAITWTCAGRVGDVLKLQRSDVTLDADFATNGNLKVLFSRGKGARFSQPYTVPSTMPEELRTIVLQYLQDFLPTQWLFPGGTKRFGPLTNQALRSANPTFTVRALRRGALQAMAENKVEFEILMVFSGHKRVDTLQRYLNWGASAGARQHLAQSAARFLQSTA
jgi:integrase